MKSQTAKAKTATPDIYPMGTVIQFKGYAGPIDGKPKCKAGETLYLQDYFAEEGGYNVARKVDGKAIDLLTVEEFTLAPETGGDQLTLNINDGVKTAPVSGKKLTAAEKKAAAIAARKTASADKKAAAAQKKADKAAAAAAKKANKKPKKVKKPEVVLPPVVVMSSVKAAIKDAGGDAVRAAVELYNGAETSYFRLGGILAVIQEKGAQATVLGDDNEPAYDADNKGFGQFVERHMGMKLRKAQYYMSGYRTFSALGVDEKRLAGIGWAKLKETIGYIDEENLDEVLKLAKATPYGAFKSEIRKRLVDSGKKRHGNSGNAHEMTTYRLVVHNDQATVFNAALKKAAEVLGVADPAEDPTTLGACHMHIVSEWMQLQG